jgi:hypothetical protein
MKPAAIVACLLITACARQAVPTPDINPFVVPAAEGTGWTRPTLEEEIATFRKDYEVEIPQKPASDCSLSFQVFIRPELRLRRAYFVGGRLYFPGKGDAHGVIVMRYAKDEKIAEERWDLSATQAGEVYGWFSDAKFLDPKTSRDVPPRVLDGVDICVDGYVEGRNFRLRRNSGDSLSTEGFYLRVEAFRIWKNLPNQTREATATAGMSTAGQPPRQP